ncbi:hypothetical protein [Micromonospora sp. CA-244673]|uniref:hypothetical protein n=1 Tax=Micromonospora sp. CA-244673 TaxID=3239958 RepID=UPI003D8E8027
MALEYGERISPDLCAGVGQLADAVELLRREHRSARHIGRTQQKIDDAVQAAGRAQAQGLNEFGEAVVTQLRTAASDLLRAAGADPTTANREVRASIRRGVGSVRGGG